MCTMLLQLPCRVLDPAEHASIQTEWPPDNSIEDLPSYLHDQNVVRLLAENTTKIREEAYGDSMEILPMLSLLVQEKISAPTGAIVEGISTKRSIYNSNVDEALSEGYASSGFMVASWRDHNTAMVSLIHKIKAAKVPMFVKRVDANDAVARTSLPAELQYSDFRAACLMEPANGMHGCYKPADSSQDIDRQQLDAYSKRNIQIQMNNECSKINTESQTDDASRIRYQKVPIFIRHCSGQVVLMVKLDESAEHMMHLFEKETKMKLVYHYFKYGNSTIDPNCTLLSYGVGRNATVEACNRLLGGKPPTFDIYCDDNKSKFLRSVTRPDGKISVDMEKKGCRILSSWLKCFTTTFAKRKSWAGRVTLKHFRVSNEHVRVLIHATLNLDTDNLKADLRELVRWIKEIFSLDGKFPPYLKNLILYLESRGFPTLLKHERIYIETHISCIESFDRGMLLVLLRKKYKSLDQSERRKWKRLVAKAELPGDTDYPDCLSNVEVFKDIIETARRRGKPYKSKKNSIFSLSRDEFTHGPEHRFDKSVEPWIEKFKDDDGIELMIPAHVDDFPAQFIMSLVHSSEIDITAELLACQVHCFCRYCQETSDKSKATSSKPSDDQEASGSGSSSNKEATGFSSSAKAGTGSGSSQQTAESSIKKENPVLHAAASKKGAHTPAPPASSVSVPSQEAESSMERTPVSYVSVLKKDIKASASPKPPPSVPPQKLPPSEANNPKPPPPEDDDGFQTVKYKKGNRRR